MSFAEVSLRTGTFSVVTTPPERPTEYLHQMLGDDAEFRPGQLDAILTVAEERGRVLLVQRTGWGKSAVYFIATKLLRDQGAGPTLLVSPLLALMRNQMQMAERLGVRAETINSTNPDQFEPILERLRKDEIDLLLVSPERFANERFSEEMLPLVSDRVGLLVIDEAHCISDWGHDFRPDYRRLVEVIELLPSGVPVLCTTATANDRVIDDVSEQLGEELVTLRGSLDRESLVLAAADMPSQADRLAWLAQTIPKLDGSGIVYVLTVADTDRVAEFLQLHGISAEAYSGATEAELRPELEQRLLDNEVKVMVATSALGMGFDKPNLGFVIHFQSPGSPIAYYQQVGRAGRSLERAPAILLHGTEDRDIQNYFIETAFPTKRQAGEVLGILAERAAPMSLAQIEADVNVRRGRLQQMLKILEVEGAVQRDGGRYQRTPVPWEYPAERVERITELRRREQDAMAEYVHQDGCLMEFLRKELDDPDAAPCGRCAGCTGEPLDVSVDQELRGAALEFLRGSPLMLQARLQWPSGVEDVKGKISEEERLEVGRVLSVLSDGGWGGLVKRGRDEDEHFDDALVDASAAFIGGRWKPDPPPEWVTCVPSMMHPDLLPDFARRLAEKLGLPFQEVLRKVAENQPQNRMENSAQQFRNVWGAFELAGEVPPGPALLIDDITDSRWTLTVIGRELRLAGCSTVYPFVLAKAVSG